MATAAPSESSIPDAFFDAEGRTAVKKWSSISGAAFDARTAVSPEYLGNAAARVAELTPRSFPIGAPPHRRHSASILATEDARARALYWLRECVDGARRADARHRHALADRRRPCLVCGARPRGPVLSCYHCVACDNCAAALRTCPVCAKPVTPGPTQHTY